jgi:hypothetical protein
VRTNFALASNGGVASASSEYSASYPVSGANNGDRRGLNWGNGGGWNDATAGSYPDWLQIDLDGNKTIDEIDVFTLQDNYQSPSEPDLNMVFSQYGISHFDVEYWNGSEWATVSGGSITGNSKVWTQIAFSPITTDKIRVQVNNSLAGYSRLVEVEAWGDPVSPTPTPTPVPTPSERTNVALLSNGGVATGSSEYNGNYPAAALNNSDRAGINWGGGGGWNDATANGYPDWAQIEFNGVKTIDEIDVFTLQDAYGSPSQPTEAMTFSLYGITAFDVQYWNGADWLTVPGGSVVGNNKVWTKVQFTPVETNKVRIVVNNSLQSYSRIVEIEAWTVGGAPSPTPTPTPGLRTNFALASNGGAASASTEHGGYPAAGANNGDRKGLNWGSGGGWNDNTSSVYPDWLQIDFNGSKTIDEINVFTVQDNFSSPAEPNETMTFSLYGITHFEVQYWNGSEWITVPNGSIENNDRVWRKVTFSGITTQSIRVRVAGSLNTYSRIAEIEAWGTT